MVKTLPFAASCFSFLCFGLRVTIHFFLPFFSSLNAKIKYQASRIKGTLVIQQFGKVVTLNGYIDGVSISSANSKIGQIPSNIDKPIDVIRSVCNVGNNAYEVGHQGYLSILTNGDIYCSVSASGTYTAMYVSLAYITD